jgi:integrase
VVLPLSPLAVRLFKAALALRRGDGPFVFEGKRPDTPLEPATASRAWAHLAAAGAVPADTTAHDMRRTMRTMLGEIDHPGSFEDEERLLGHSIGSAVSRAYDRGRRLARLRPLADAWGTRLEAIVSGPPAEVRELRGQGKP